MPFPFVKQPDVMDCGPACLKMIAAFYGKNFTIDSIRKKSYITREGVSFLGLSEAAEKLGFRTLGVKVSVDVFSENVPFPCIIHWRQKHFIVVYKIKKETVYAADPATGLIKLSKNEFTENWCSTIAEGKPAGLVLMLEPTPAFYEAVEEAEPKTGFKFLYKYFKLYKRYLWQIIIGLVLGSFIQLIIPFLTRSVVDIGLNNSDLGFIYLILIAQLVLIISRLSVEFIRSWLLLHIGTKINISIISGFLQKMMSLPIAFFDTKLTGDILQRIEDNTRIEEFLTSTGLNIIFSFFNLMIFGIVLALFSLKILFVFISGAILYAIWIYAFMEKRARLDQYRFKQMSDAANKLINIINGMQEIKLTKSEQIKRWEWENQQASLFRLKLRSLGILQNQTAGATFINEVSNILITIISATAVLKGEMTLGAMLAVQFIIGQMNVPVSQIISFFRISQDAKMSLNRLSEVHSMEEEEPDPQVKQKKMPAKKDIYLNNISFQYEGPHSPFVLKNIDLYIKEGKMTAIVGSSGSGKTTLLKLLLGFYQPVAGDILVGDTRLPAISLQTWREKTGAVMQDGYLFPDTIANNIAPWLTEQSEDRLIKAAEVANIKGFIESLPLGFNTKIGANGHGLSEGQKQRLLIARVIYKNPDILFFDEATNSLDANTERAIVENLSEFFAGKTVVVVAHRLSTVKNADLIVVLDEGRIVETGNHSELIAKKGAYYKLVRNQLELGT